jgi:hypothetical protein
VGTGDKVGMVDRKGEWVIQPQFDQIYPDYPDSDVFAQLPQYFARDRAAAKMGDLWGYIDRKGDWAINPQFVNQAMFDESGLAPAAIKTGDETKWGFIDRDGKWAVNPQFTSALRFGNAPLAGIQVAASGWGFIGKDGKYAINPRFDSVGRFDRNSGKWLAAAAEKPGGDTRRYGYVDQTGAFAINAQFAYAGMFDSNRRARVRFGDDWGLIGPDGTFEVNPSYNLLLALPGSDLYFFEADDPDPQSDVFSSRFGVVDARGKERIVWTGVSCDDMF